MFSSVLHTPIVDNPVDINRAWPSFANFLINYIEASATVVAV